MNKTEVLPFADSHREYPVRGYFHIPANPSSDGLVITHGAGSNCQSPLLIALATSFSESGMTVLRCDLNFRQLRPHGPPPRGSAERDQQGLRSAIDAIRQKVSGRVFLGGHSYGGRQASILAASDAALVDALLLLSYPLHPPKRPSELRTTHFPTLHTPALFVHGGEAQTLRFYSHPPLGRREYFGRGGNPTFTDGGVQAAGKRWEAILSNAYIQTQSQRSGSTVGRLRAALRLTDSNRFYRVIPRSIPDPLFRLQRRAPQPHIQSRHGCQFKWRASLRILQSCVRRGRERWKAAGKRSKCCRYRLQ